MKALERIRVAAVGAVPHDALEASGAKVVAVDLPTLLADAGSWDVVLFGAAADGGAAPLVAELAADPRARLLPRLVLADGAEHAWKVASAGATTMLPADAPARQIVAALEELGAPRRAATELDEAIAERTRAIELLGAQRSNLVHDLGTMLGVALGFACNLRDGIDATLDESAREQVLRIVDALGDASALLGRFAAPSPGASPSGSAGTPAKRRRKDARRARVDLVALAREIGALFSSSARDGAVTLDVPQVDTSQKAHSVDAWCEAVGMKQVVVNLVTNALKVTPRGGRIAIEAERFAPSAREGEGRELAQIIVSDSGPGVPIEHRERIFERGFRLPRDAATTSGRGIGLTIVADIVAAHHGTVHVDESAFGGAAFVVRVPTDLRSRT